jgi:hypothetical protein
LIRKYEGRREKRRRDKDNVKVSHMPIQMGRQTTVLGRQTTVLGRQTRERDGEMDEKLMRRHISEGRRRVTDSEKDEKQMGRKTRGR